MSKKSTQKNQRTGINSLLTDNDTKQKRKVRKAKVSKQVLSIETQESEEHNESILIMSDSEQTLGKSSANKANNESMNKRKLENNDLNIIKKIKLEDATNKLSPLVLKCRDQLIKKQVDGNQTLELSFLDDKENLRQSLNKSIVANESKRKTTIVSNKSLNDTLSICKQNQCLKSEPDFNQTPLITIVEEDETESNPIITDQIEPICHNLMSIPGINDIVENSLNDYLTQMNRQSKLKILDYFNQKPPKLDKMQSNEMNTNEIDLFISNNKTNQMNDQIQNTIDQLERVIQEQKIQMNAMSNYHDSRLNEIILEASHKEIQLRNQYEKQIAETKLKQWCIFCGRESSYYCCWNVSYCDEMCQRLHWNSHSIKCRRKLASSEIVLN